MTRVLERLRELDDRVLPPTSGPPRRWHLVVDTLVVTSFANYAITASTAWGRAAALILTVHTCIAFADRVRRFAAAHSTEDASRRLQAVARVGFVIAAVGLTLQHFYVSNRTEPVGRDEAFALASYAVAAANADDPRFVCRMTRDEDDCLERLRAAPEPSSAHRAAVPVSITRYDAGYAEVVLSLGTTDRTCGLTLSSRGGAVHIDNPAYWTNCHPRH